MDGSFYWVCSIGYLVIRSEDVFTNGSLSSLSDSRELKRVLVTPWCSNMN